MDKGQKSWFDKISPTSLTDGKDYLDRLTGNQKPIFQRNNRNPPPVKASKKNNPAESSIPLFEVDSTQWIEERRKKFPRANGSGRQSVEATIVGPVSRKKTLFEKLMDDSK